MLKEGKQKVIEFDLEKAKSGKYDLVQRDGTQVREWKHFEKLDQNETCIISVSGFVSYYWHFINGQCHQNTFDKDLMLIPKKKKLYLSVSSMKSNNGYYATSQAYEDKNDLKELSNIIEIEIDEE